MQHSVPIYFTCKMDGRPESPRLNVYCLSMNVPLLPSLLGGVRVKQRAYFLLVSATEMAIWQAILT
jgi:hypothetical protein